MEALKQRIRREGKNLGRGILKVDSFLNHQVDPALMLAAGGALAAHFGALGITKVLTAEISGIAPALTTALALGVPVVYGRKTKPSPCRKIFTSKPPLAHQRQRSCHYGLAGISWPEDKVLIIDDFLATGYTIMALVRVAQQAGAEVIGVGAVIEKSFEGGRAALEAMGLRVRSLACIKEMTDTEIIFAEGVSP
jgi:xanthine phosphoribosyltransferase